MNSKYKILVRYRLIFKINKNIIKYKYHYVLDIIHTTYINVTTNGNYPKYITNELIFTIFVSIYLFIVNFFGFIECNNKI